MATSFHWKPMPNRIELSAAEIRDEAPSVASPPSAASFSIKIAPTDRRCRYWAKIFPSAKALPLPKDVQGANDLPAPYCKRGDEELFAGDVLIEGEANHHRRTDRGWTYWVVFVTPEGKLVRYVSGFSEQKAAAKAQGLAPELLSGSGDVAGAVRVAHALRAGMVLPGAA